MGRPFFYSEWNGTIQQKRNENGMIYLKALVLERNGTISKKSERAQPYRWRSKTGKYEFTDSSCFWGQPLPSGATQSSPGINSLCLFAKQSCETPHKSYFTEVKSQILEVHFLTEDFKLELQLIRECHLKFVTLYETIEDLINLVNVNWY